MRRLSSILSVAIIAVLAAMAAAQGDGKKEIKLEQSWTGRLIGVFR